MKGTGLLVCGALALAVLGLSTGSGQAQTTTQNSTQTTGQAQSQTSNSVSNGVSSSLSGAASTNDSLNAGSQNVGINFNTPAAPTNTTQTVKNVPSVYAPGLAAAGSEVCLGSISAGGAGAGFGVTLGGTIVDRECQLRLNARTLAVLGYPAAARETMCLDPNVRQAMLAAGTPCAGDRVVYGYAPNTAPQRVVADPRNSRAAVEPVQNAPQQTVAASEPASSAAFDLAPGCHKEYQLLGGWYPVCDNTQTAAPPPTADADPVQDQPPVRAVRRKSTAAAQSAQADHHKPMQAAQQRSVAAAQPQAAPWQTMDPMQADQPKPTSAAKPTQADQPKPLSALTPVQADQPKPIAAAKPVQADQPKPIAAAKPMQADQPKPVAAAKPAQADQPKPIAAAKPVQADQPKPIAAAKPVQADQPKPIAAAKPVQADQPKPIAAAKPVQADQPKPTAAAKPVQADQPKPTAAAKPVQAADQPKPTAAAKPMQADPKPIAAAKPVQNEPQQTAAASEPASSEAFALAPGCHKQYQLFGGWYPVCDNAQANADAAQDQPPVKRNVRRKSATGAKSAPANQNKSTQVEQTDQGKSERMATRSTNINN